MQAFGIFMSKKQVEMGWIHLPYKQHMAQLDVWRDPSDRPRLWLNLKGSIKSLAIAVDK